MTANFLETSQDPSQVYDLSSQGGLQLPVHVQTKKENHFWVAKNGLFSLLFPTVCTWIGSSESSGGRGHIPGKGLGKFLKNWRSSFLFVNFCLKIGKKFGFVTRFFQKFISTVYTVISKQKLVEVIARCLKIIVLPFI